MSRYIHDNYTHNHDSPGEIVAILHKNLHPASVIDIGCGVGTFLYQFKKQGVAEVLGIDGPWANRELLRANLEEKEFIEMNLEQPIALNRKFDLAICLEVAEHIDVKYSDTLLSSLTNLSDTILFSAAIPYQDGQNHLNEQWMDYWVKKFDQYDYQTADVIRPLIWNNQKVQWWYKQNLFLAYRKGTSIDLGKFSIFAEQGRINNYVHPDNYIAKVTRLNDILNGKQTVAFYFRQIVKKLMNPVKKSH